MHKNIEVVFCASPLCLNALTPLAELCSDPKVPCWGCCLLQHFPAVYSMLLNAKVTRDGEGQQNQATAWLGDAKDPNHPAWLRGPGPPSFGDFWGSPSGIEDMSFFWGDTHAQHVDINALKEALREDMRIRSKRLKREWFKFQVHLESIEGFLW